MNITGYNRIEEEILGKYASIHYLPLRLEALRHTIRVMDMICLLDTDTPLLQRKMAALLHDYGRFICNAGNHASRSAQEAECRFPEYPEVSEAIRHHSDKDRVDSPLSEDLKDADVLARWLDDPDGYEHPRLQPALARIRTDLSDFQKGTGGPLHD